MICVEKGLGENTIILTFYMIKKEKCAVIRNKSFLWCNMEVKILWAETDFMMFAGRKGRESSMKKQMISTVIEKMQELIDTIFNISNCVSSSEHSEFGPEYEKGSLSRQNRHIDGEKRIILWKVKGADTQMIFFFVLPVMGVKAETDICADQHLALWIALLPRL